MTGIVEYDHELIELCENGSIYETARKLHISEVTLNRHMHLLEEEVAHTLFLKMGSHVELTDFGHVYLSYALRYRALDREKALAIRHFDARTASTVRLVAAHSMNCDHIVNMLTDHFNERLPQYSVDVGEFSRTLKLPEIFAMGYELVFATGSTPKPDGEFECFPWSSDHLVAVLPLSHPLAHRKSIRLSQLAEDKFILFPEGSFLHYYSTTLCRRAGFEPKIDFTIHGTRNMAELVAAGIGVSLTPDSDIYPHRKMPLAIVPLDPAPGVYLNLYYRKDQTLSDAADAFLKYAIEIHDTHAKDIPYQGPEGPVGNIYFT